MPLPQPDGSPADDAFRSDDAVSPDLHDVAFDAVLRATAETAAADERATAEEIDALRAVARRHGPAPLVFDPVAIELVEAIILVNYGPLHRPPEVWRATAAKIAAVLVESPEARARLENLWARLLESDAPAQSNA